MNDGTDRVSRLPLAQRMTVVDMLIDGKRHGEVREALREMGCPEADIPSDFSLNSYKKTDECEQMYLDRVKLFRAQRDGALMEGRLDGESTATLVEIAETLRGTHRNGDMMITEMLAVFRAMVDYKRVQIAAAREARMWGGQSTAVPRVLRAMAAAPEGDLPAAAGMDGFFAPQHEPELAAAVGTPPGKPVAGTPAPAEAAHDAELDAKLDAELDAVVGDLAAARADLQASSAVAASVLGLPTRAAAPMAAATVPTSTAPAATAASCSTPTDARPRSSETERSVAICSKIERSAGVAPTTPPETGCAAAASARPVPPAATDWSRGLSWAASQALAEGRAATTQRAAPVSATARAHDATDRREATADAYRAASDRVCADWWGPPEEDDDADLGDLDLFAGDGNADRSDLGALDRREQATWAAATGGVPSPGSTVHHRLGRPGAVPTAPAAPPGRAATG